MTVVLAAATPAGVVLAADTLSTDGQLKLYGTSSKLWSVGPYAIGGAGAKRVLQVIQHCTDWPTYRPDEDTDVEAFLVTQVVPAVLAACEREGVLDTDQRRFDAELLLVLGKTIASIDDDGCVFIDASGRWAIGSGAQVALGALGVDGPWTAAAVAEAGRRAMVSVLGCGGSLDVLTIPDGDEPAG